MSKHLLSVMLNELKTVRLICKKCRSVTEIGIDKLEKSAQLQCPTCPALFRTDANDDAIVLLGRCMRLLSLPAGNAADIEFIIPAKD